MCRMPDIAECAVDCGDSMSRKKKTCPCSEHGKDGTLDHDFSQMFLFSHNTNVKFTLEVCANHKDNYVRSAYFTEVPSGQV
jgi:hypothetical protein